MGPVTLEEYESRAERYDRQLKQQAGFNVDGKATPERLAVLRAYREEQYERLKDAVYQRRGWTITEVVIGGMLPHFGGQPGAGFAGIPVRDEIRLEKRLPEL